AVVDGGTGAQLPDEEPLDEEADHEPLDEEEDGAEPDVDGDSDESESTHEESDEDGEAVEAAAPRPERRRKNKKRAFKRKARVEPREAVKYQPSFDLGPMIKQAPQSHHARATPPGRVLWVDDEPERNMVIIDLLQQLGTDVVLVKSTHEALRVYEPGSFDLVITDMARSHRESGLRLLDALENLGDAPQQVIVYERQYTPALRRA